MTRSDLTRSPRPQKEELDRPTWAPSGFSDNTHNPAVNQPESESRYLIGVSRTNHFNVTSSEPTVLDSLSRDKPLQPSGGCDGIANFATKSKNSSPLSSMVEVAEGTIGLMGQTEHSANTNPFPTPQIDSNDRLIPRCFHCQANEDEIELLHDERRHVAREFSKKHANMIRKRDRAAKLQQQLTYQRGTCLGILPHLRQSLGELEQIFCEIGDSNFHGDDIQRVQKIKLDIVGDIQYFDYQSRQLQAVESQVLRVESKLQRKEKSVHKIAKRLDSLLRDGRPHSTSLAQGTSSHASPDYSMHMDMPQLPPSPDLLEGFADTYRGYETPGQSTQIPDASELRCKISEWMEQCDTPGDAGASSRIGELNPIEQDIEMGPDRPQDIEMGTIDHTTLQKEAKGATSTSWKNAFGNLLCRTASLNGLLSKWRTH